jgi:hypothetical protein
MKLLVSALTAFCAATVAAVPLAWAAGGIGPGVAAVAACIGIALGAAAWDDSTRREPYPRQPLHGWGDTLLALAFAAFALRSFGWLAYWKGEEIAFLSPNNFGDLSLHLAQIGSLAHGTPFWPDNPIFTGTPLHYPFGVDLFNALLTVAGVPVLRGLIWVGLLASAATLMALRRWGGPFAVAGFLFNGGIAAWAWFSTGTLRDFQDNYLAADGTTHAIAWKSIPLALFVTQRGLLYALPAGLLVLWSWRARFFRKHQAERALPFWVETLLYATMPLFHLHTFLFLSFLLGCWLLAFPSLRGPIARRIAAALLPATILGLLVTGGVGHGGGMIHWKPGWMQDEPFALFWFRNFGFLPFAVAALLVWLWRQRAQDTTREAAAFALPSLALFGITCFVMFAPWEWDNTKLMIWCYLALLPPLWTMLCTVTWPVRAVTCVALFFSGAISLAGGLKGEGYTLAHRNELDGLAVALRPIPATARFACEPTYNHPLLLLGYRVLVGYPGHLFSHGIRYEPCKAQLDRLLRGEADWRECATALHADYLYWSKHEEAAYPDSTRAWAETLPVVAKGKWGKLYDLRDLQALSESKAATP